MNDPTIHYISSSYRNSQETISNFSYTFTVSKNHNRISLVDMNIPKSFYLIESPNNTFYLGATLYTLLEGNYDRTTFKTAINNLITPSTINYSNRTNRWTITSSSNSITLPDKSDLIKPFGFPAGTTSFSSTIEAPYNMNFQRLNQVYILSNIVQSNDIQSFGNILHRFFINDIPQYANLIFVNTQIYETSKKLINPNSADGENTLVTQIRLVDENNKEIDLNGINYDLSFITFREDDTYSIIKSNYDLNRRLVSYKLESKK